MLSGLTVKEMAQKIEKLSRDLLNDIEKVSPILVIMAKQEDGEALYRVGNLYYAKQTKQDYLKAFEWFQLSSYQQHGEAYCMIGQMYQYGKGVLVNHDKAIQFYSIAVSLESVKAKYQLGCMHHYGIGCPPSYSDAFQWYSKAAHHNNADAQNGLGYLYEKGQGVTQSNEVAMYWYDRAACNGNNQAGEKVEAFEKENIKPKSPFQKKSLDFNQMEVLKSIKALMINDSSNDQIFTKKLESLVMERRFRLI